MVSFKQITVWKKRRPNCSTSGSIQK